MSTLKIVFHVVFRQHQNTSYARSHISENFIEKIRQNKSGRISR